MKFGIVSTMVGAPWGGSEELWSQTADHLARSHTVHINCRYWPVLPRQLLGLQTSGCHIVRRKSRHGLIERIKRRLGYSDYKWLDLHPFDLVVISQGAPLEGIEWMIECKKRSIPYVSITHVVAESAWPDDRTAELAIAALDSAHISYFVSQKNLELMRKQLGAPLTNSRVVRNPFGVSYDTRPTWPSSDKEYRLACVGRLYPAAKGQDLLFEVLAQDKWKARNLTVTLYGTGDCNRSLERLKDIYKLEKVIFAGHTDDIEKIWRDNHALIMASRYEGLPITIVEAMLCGRLCIVTDVAGNAEVVRDNANGFVAAAPVARLVDDALERAWARRQEWELIGGVAAANIRTLVDRDPAESFSRELLQCVGQ